MLPENTPTSKISFKNIGKYNAEILVSRDSDKCRNFQAIKKTHLLGGGELRYYDEQTIDYPSNTVITVGYRVYESEYNGVEVKTTQGLLTFSFKVEPKTDYHVIVKADKKSQYMRYLVYAKNKAGKKYRVNALRRERKKDLFFNDYVKACVPMTKEQKMFLRI